MKGSRFRVQGSEEHHVLAVHGVRVHLQDPHRLRLFGIYDLFSIYYLLFSCIYFIHHLSFTIHLFVGHVVLACLSLINVHHLALTLCFEGFTVQGPRFGRTSCPRGTWRPGSLSGSPPPAGIRIIIH